MPGNWQRGALWVIAGANGGSMWLSRPGLRDLRNLAVVESAESSSRREGEVAAAYRLESLVRETP